MGKRKERRQQASSARRVKLDLLSDAVAELPPSETLEIKKMDDVSLGEEVIPIENQGVLKDNPLALLGQYSDDEAEEEDIPSEQPDNATTNAAHEIQNVVQAQQINDESFTVSGSQILPCLSEDHGTGNSATAVVHGNGSSGDISLSDQWQAVLLEESGEYYYWNMKTGETTWEKPYMEENVEHAAVSGIVVAGCDSHNHHNSVPTVSPPVSAHAYEKAIDDLKVEANETIVKEKQDDTSLGSDAAVLEETKDEHKICLEERENTHEVFEVGKVESSLENADGDVNDGMAKDAEGGEQIMDNGCTKEISGDKQEIENMVEVTDKDNNDTDGSEDKEIRKSVVVDSQDERVTEIVEKGNVLLQRLGTLTRPALTNVPHRTRMAIQAEARISDWKAFLSLGVIMPEPYWIYIQSQMMQLEAFIALEEAATETETGALNAMQVAQNNHGNFDGSYTSESHHFENTMGWSARWANYWEEMTKRRAAPSKGSEVEEAELLMAYHNVYSGVPVIPSDPNTMTTATVNQEISKVGDADVDMEVDMEVDEEAETEPAVPGLSSDVHITSMSANPYNLSSQSGMNSSYEAESGQLSVPSEAWMPPLPPDDEWAPPPPCEVEVVPPHPPEESPPLPPPLPSSTHSLSVPVIPSAVGGEYYATEYPSDYVTMASFMPSVEYQQMPDASLYGIYAEEASGAVYALSAQMTEAYSSQPVPGSGISACTATTLPTGLLPVSMPVLEANQKALESLQLPATTSASVATTVEMTVELANMELKQHTKSKSGKRKSHSIAVTPMLISNKKVSSLVTKWKQAKEELHGSEEDEDDRAFYDLEVMEKKKQKEIEEWRRQQIASGDALDNANFQPLGSSDWREKVKRAQKLDCKESDFSLESSLSTSGAWQEESQKSKPDLAKVSRGLPPGWQAYWDEASGEVYYGNLNTQETRWDRPVTKQSEGK